MKATDDGCVLKEQQEKMRVQIENIDGRLTQVEHDVGKMRSETADGFRRGEETMGRLNVSVANLAHDFGERMNGIDARLVEEKQKWGNCLREILRWAVRVILAGACVAMGVTAFNTVASKLFPAQPVSNDQGGIYMPVQQTRENISSLQPPAAAPDLT